MAAKNRKTHHRPDAKNTIDPGTVTLNDQEIEILDNIAKHWNQQKPTDPPTWDARTVLAQLATLTLKSMAADYGDEPRPPTYTVGSQKPLDTPETLPDPLTPPPAEA